MGGLRFIPLVCQSRKAVFCFNEAGLGVKVKNGDLILCYYKIIGGIMTVEYSDSIVLRSFLYI